MQTFATWDEVPLFESEAAEAVFWLEQRPALRLMASAVAGQAEAPVRAAPPGRAPAFGRVWAFMVNDWFLSRRHEAPCAPNLERPRTRRPPAV